MGQLWYLQRCQWTSIRGGVTQPLFNSNSTQGHTWHLCFRPSYHQCSRPNKLVQSPRNRQSWFVMDHRTVFFEFHTLVKAPVRTHRSVYDYAKGDFDGLRNALRSVNLTSVKTCAVMNLIKKKETVCRKLKLHLLESLKVKFQVQD